MTHIPSRFGRGREEIAALARRLAPTHEAVLEAHAARTAAQPDLTLGRLDAIRAEASRRQNQSDRQAKSSRTQTIRKYRILSAILTVASDWLCAVSATLILFSDDASAPAVVALPALWIGAAAMHGLYARRSLSGSEEFGRLMRAALTAASTAAVASLVTVHSVIEVRSVLLMPLLTAVLCLMVRKTIRAPLVRRSGLATRPALLVGTAAQCSEMAAILRRERSALLPVASLDVVGSGPDPMSFPQSSHNPADPLNIGTLTAPSSPSHADQVATALQVTGCEVVVLMPSPHLGAVALSNLGWRLASLDADILVAPSPSEITPARLSRRRDGAIPLFHIRPPRLSSRSRMPKEIGERVTAAISILLLSPLFLAISLAILVSDGRPVYFRQTRVGLRGEPFTLYKFRTMSVGAAEATKELAHLNVNSDGPLFKMRQDPRVTRIGRVLRSRSLDELPQLFNVVRGDMSLVGPRPPLPEEAEKYSEELRSRLLVKPGLTGLWKVSARSDLALADAVRLDLGYVENWSLGLDAEILLRTGTAVVMGKGAY